MSHIGPKRRFAASQSYVRSIGSEADMPASLKRRDWTQKPKSAEISVTSA